MFETAGQAWVFLAMVYGGLAMGVLYDLLCLLRHVLRAGPFATGLVDLIFWLAAAVLASCALAYSGGGIQPYTLLGMGCGALLYVLGVGRVFRAIARWVARVMPRKKSSPTPAELEGIPESSAK